MEEISRNNTNKCEEVSSSDANVQIDEPKPEIAKMTVENDVEQPLRNYFNIKNTRENYTISTDHCYARPWNWKNDSNFLRPTKTMFMSKNTPKIKFPHLIYEKCEDEENLDVESVDNDARPPIYDVSKAQLLMDECDKYVKILKNDDSDNPFWDEDIPKNTWKLTQTRLFNGVVAILNNHYLAKLACSNVKYEAIVRRTIIEKSVQRLRRLMATVFWDTELTQWLHQLLLDRLNMDYLSIYLEILQTLKAKLPSFVEKMIQNAPSNFKLGISTENLLPVLKRPWDPVLTNFPQEKHKLPGNPVIIVIPSSPVASTRHLKWINLLSSLGTVVNIPFNLGSSSGSSGQRLTTMHCADQMFASIRGQIQEIRAEHPNRNLVLLGFNAGAAMALQVAQTEPVLAVICMGFSLLTAEGKRGEPEDALMELQCPVLFIIGQCSTTSSQEDMEDLRERMRVETGLVVIGSADNFLRISRKKKKSEGITQSIVDRCIVDEIGEFISSIILSPYPPQIRQSPTHVTQDSGKKTRLERKRYNSNTSSLDSEDFSPQMPVRISRPVGRPPGSKAKSKLEQKWAAQIAQGTNPSSNSSSPCDTPIILDTSSDNSVNSEHYPKIQPPSNSLLMSKLKSSLTTPSSSISAENTIKKVKTLKPKSAKMQAYGMKHNLVAGSRLSSLLQGGIKTIPPSQPNNPIKVLENITITPPTGNKLFQTSGKSLTVVGKDAGMKPGSSGSNVIILPDGKLKTIGAANIFRSENPRYITSKKQLLGNKPPKPVKKLSGNGTFKQGGMLSTLPPPTNLTTQDIMDLPIIFADDNQLIDAAETSTVSPKPTAPNKFVLVNKPINFTSSNFIINGGGGKKSQITHSSSSSGNVYRQTPKYTKIILSKRTPPTDSRNPVGGSPNILSKISNLSSEISVRKIGGSVQMDDIDLENELVATTIPKPSFSSLSGEVIRTSNAVMNVERIKRAFNSPPTQLVAPPISSLNKDEDDDDSDPDYIPPKMVKLN